MNTLGRISQSPNSDASPQSTSQHSTDHRRGRVLRNDTHGKKVATAVNHTVTVGVVHQISAGRRQHQYRSECTGVFGCRMLLAKDICCSVCHVYFWQSSSRMWSCSVISVVLYLPLGIQTYIDSDASKARVCIKHTVWRSLSTCAVMHSCDVAGYCKKEL